MSLILSGTDGLSDVDGSASTPAIRGTDTNTGIFFPAADTIAFAEGGAEVARFNSSGNFLIKTIDGRIGSDVGSVEYGTSTTNSVKFFSDNTERMRIDSSGNLLVGTTSNPDVFRMAITGENPVTVASSTITGIGYRAQYTAASGTFYFGYWQYNGSAVGFISSTGSTTVYSTTSDYRLKENIAPMTGALARVALLKPSTYTWKATGEESQGFIAHELQEVCPDAVTGEKDAVDEEGNPQYQGIDTSFLVATLTAAIQEQQAIITDLKARLEVLEAK
jgi:hypothetical protein